MHDGKRSVQRALRWPSTDSKAFNRSYEDLDNFYVSIELEMNHNHLSGFTYSHAPDERARNFAAHRFMDFVPSHLAVEKMHTVSQLGVIKDDTPIYMISHRELVSSAGHPALTWLLLENPVSNSVASTSFHQTPSNAIIKGPP